MTYMQIVSLCLRGTWFAHRVLWRCPRYGRKCKCLGVVWGDFTSLSPPEFSRVLLLPIFSFFSTPPFFERCAAESCELDENANLATAGTTRGYLQSVATSLEKGWLNSTILAHMQRMHRLKVGTEWKVNFQPLFWTTTVQIYGVLMHMQRHCTQNYPYQQLPCAPKVGRVEIHFGAVLTEMLPGLQMGRYCGPYDAPPWDSTRW